MVPGALLAVYTDNTTDKASIYSDEGLTTALANPVEANASGHFPAIWAEAGTVEAPTLYTLAISAADGSSIGNPAVFTGWQPSLDAETATSALAEAAAADAEASAAAAAADLADMLAVQASGDDAAAIAARAAKAANLSDLADKEAATSNLLYKNSATGAVARAVQAVLQDRINAKDFGAACDGVTDDAAALRLGLAAAITQGKVLHIPGSVRVDTAIELELSDYASFQTAFCPGVRIEGAGSGRTVIDSRVANGHWLSIDNDNPHTSTFQGILGGWIRGVTIRNGDVVVASSGVKLRAQYQFLFEDVHFFDLSGSAVTLECLDGDLDAPVHVTFDRCRIERCDKWGIDAVATGVNNEIGFVRLQDTAIQYCGLDESKVISAVTKANPAVVTSTAHGFANGTDVYLCGIQGMTQADSFVSDRHYRVANATADTFELTAYDSGSDTYVNVNSTAYTTFTLRTATVTGVTNAAVAVVTATAHGFSNGQIVMFASVGGMTQLNGNQYKIANVTANTFELQTTSGVNVNSTAYGVYTSGGTVAPPPARIMPRDPQSGGMRWKGQILRVDNSGWAVNYNASLYIPGGSGLAQDVYITNSTIENPIGFGLLTTGIRNMRIDLMHLYSNAIFGHTFAGIVMDGGTSNVSDIYMNQLMLRSTAAEFNYVAVKGFGATYDPHSVRVRNTCYKQFDYLGQRRFEGIHFDAIPRQCEIVLTSTTNVRLQPTGSGAVMPLKRIGPVIGDVASTTGEWVEYVVPSTGLNQDNKLPDGSALANSTTYNVYMWYDVSLTRPDLELSTTARAVDSASGYWVKSGDPTRLYVGRVRTDGAGAFVIADTPWLNPEVIPAPVTGAEATRWTQTNGYISVKTTAGLPSSAAAGTFNYWPTLETLVTYDAPSLAAGASTTVDVTVVCSAGDYCSGVRFATGFAGLSAYGCVKAANTVTVTLTNHTAGAIDLASGLLGVAIQRR